MDLHRKGVFNMPGKQQNKQILMNERKVTIFSNTMAKSAVSEMEAPPAHFDGTVDTKKIWDSVMSEIICSGLLECKFT